MWAWLILYGLLLHLVIIMLLCGRGRGIWPVFREQDRALKKAHFQSQMRSFHRRVDEMGESGAIVLLGASGIQGMNLQSLRGKALNFGIGGDTSEGLLERIDDYRSLGSARAVVIAIGFNDLRRKPEMQTCRNIEEICKRLPDSGKVLLCAIAEVDESKGLTGYNERIRKINSELSLMAEKEGHIFADVSTILLERFEGERHEYLEADGIHLNRAGRTEWLKAVVSLLESHDAVDLKE